MIKNFCVFLAICALLAWWGYDPRSEHEKIAHKVMYNAQKTLEKRYGLRRIGTYESGDKSHYKAIGLHFQVFRVLSKDEGRKILIDTVEELLKEINGDPNLKPFLNPEVFTPANINVAIFAYQPDGKIAFYPDILVFSSQRNRVEFDTKIPEEKYGYYTEEVETYEEALNIVRSQSGVMGSGLTD